MRVSRSRCTTAAAVFAGLVGIAAPVSAQKTEPVRLAPPKSLTAPAPLPSASEPAAPDGGKAVQGGYKAGPGGISRANVLSGGSTGIQVDRLSAVTPDSAGILSAEAGGFGADMWRGTDVSRAKRLIAGLPARIPSRAVSRLIRRLLLSQAEPPAGSAEDGEMAGLRLSRLMSMGDYSGALDLMSVMPRQGRGASLLQAEAELRFLGGENIAGCRLVGNEVRTSEKEFWQKALVFCQLLSDQPRKAELGLTLLREVGAEDPLFFTLTEAMLGGGVAELEDLSTAAPLTLAMVVHAKVNISPTALESMGPGALQVMALNKDLALPLRVAAVERLARTSVASDGALRKILANVMAADYAGGEDAPATDGPLGRVAERARLLAAATAATVPVAKAEALSQALRSARADGTFVGAARLYGPVLAQIPVGSDLLWFAADAFRAGAVNGEWEKAEAWLAMLRRASAMTEEAAAVMKGLAPIAQVFRGASQAAAVPAELAGMDSGPGIFLHALLSGLGQPVPMERWTGWSGAPPAVSPPMPPSALWFTLVGLNASGPAQQAAEPTTVSSAGSWKATASAGAVLPSASGAIAVEALGAPTAGTRSDLDRKAERLLVMAHVLAARDLTRVHPAALYEVLRGLVGMGLEQEARALALEAALEAGL